MADQSPLAALVLPRLIVGLGNPGGKYAGTRHNVGFELVDILAQRWQISLKDDRRFQGIYGDGMARGGRISLLKPQTYMNRSGQSIRAVVDWFKLEPGSVLVVYDDMDLPVGRLRLRLSGSAGGHNGMKSAIAHLGTQVFPRMRIGIGTTHPGEERDAAVVSHVLGRFAPPDRDRINTVLDYAAKALELSLESGVEKAMSYYNGCSAD